jgi:hypothetical protein
MVTYEDITRLFLQTAATVGLTTHPEYWMNAETLEREFACTCHMGSCEEAENRSACTVSFTWGALDTVLSLEGPTGICDFFHEPDDQCPHLHTDDVPALALDLAYSVNFSSMPLSDIGSLQLLARTLKLRASEHSSRASETRPGVALVLGDSGMQVEALTLQQRVEIPLWHPEGRIRGISESGSHAGRYLYSLRRLQHEDVNRDPHPKEWLPAFFAEVCADIARVLAALDIARALGHAE